MAERGIAKYTTGKKDVTCELFLDVLLFDEHTCKAEATVCWDGSVPQGGVDQTAGGEPAKDAPTKAAAKKPAKSDAAIETGSTDKAPAAAPAKEPAAAAAKEEAPAAEDARQPLPPLKKHLLPRKLPLKAARSNRNVTFVFRKRPRLAIRTGAFSFFGWDVAAAQSLLATR